MTILNLRVSVYGKLIYSHDNPMAQLADNRSILHYEPNKKTEPSHKTSNGNQIEDHNYYY